MNVDTAKDTAGRSGTLTPDQFEAYQRADLQQRTQLREHYNSRNPSDRYATSRDYNMRELEIEAISTQLPPGDILDLGCGNGDFPRPQTPGPASFNYSISDGHGGLASNTVSLNVTAPPTTQSLFSASNTPAVTSANDGKQLEVGVKFTSPAVAGSISGIEFSGPRETPDEYCRPVEFDGDAVAQGNLSRDTSASGWQTVTFSSPVAITAGTTYVVASYNTTGLIRTQLTTSRPLTPTAR